MSPSPSSTSPQALQTIRTLVKALEKPAPHLFRALYLEASERVFQRNADLLKQAAAEKERSDAAMMRIFMSRANRPHLGGNKTSFLDQIHKEDHDDERLK